MSVGVRAHQRVGLAHLRVYSPSSKARLDANDDDAGLREGAMDDLDEPFEASLDRVRRDASADVVVA